MSKRQPQSKRNQRGVVTVLVVMSLIGLIGMTALAVDSGWVLTTRAQLQHTADSGALAAIGAIRDGLTPAQALAEARAVVESPFHEAGGEPVRIGAGDLELGTFDIGTGLFTPGTGGPGVSAVRSTVRRSAGSPAGALDLFLGGVLGVSQVDVEATAVAAVRRRDIVLLQDRTWSFRQEFANAIDADLDLLQAITGPRALAGDRMAIASFNRIAAEDIGLVPLDTRSADVRNAILDLQVCTSTGLPGCGGTGTADALDVGISIFERDAVDEDSEKVMILLTDGVPCHDEVGYGDAERVGKEAAREAAQRVRDASINLYVVHLELGGSGVCQDADASFSEELVAGFGYAVSTPDAEDLDDLLISIVQQMPVRLVD